MNISLPPKMEYLIREKVATGLYHSASEVVREALRLLEERDQFQAAKLTALRQELQKGIDSLAHEPAVAYDIEQIKQKAKAELK